MMLKTLVPIAFALVLVGCDKGGDGKAGAGAASGAAKTTGAPAAGATTKLTKAQLDEAYTAVGFDPYDKALPGVTAKLGAPAKTDATSSTWYGTDGKNCYRLVMTKTKGTESGSTENANCGLK